MAKKIKFALEMPDGAKVRTIEDLREHFDLEKILGYYFDGKLLEWLEDRYYEKSAKDIRALDSNAFDFKQKLCSALGVAYVGEDISAEDIAAMSAKKARLRKLTSDEEIISHAGETAFSQEELADLLDAGVRNVYLCGEKFHLPTSVKNCCYIGILGEPKVHIDVESIDDLRELGISLEHVRFAKYLEIRRYVPSEMFASILKKDDHDAIKKLYEEAQKTLGYAVFDIEKFTSNNSLMSKIKKDECDKEREEEKKEQEAKFNKAKDEALINALVNKRDYYLKQSKDYEDKAIEFKNKAADYEKKLVLMIDNSK